jgi:undecaprenyl-diphosphatase
MDWLVLDRKLFFAINRGLSNDVFDVLFLAVTEKGHWLFLPLFVHLFVSGMKERKRGAPSFLRDASLGIALSTVSILLGDWFGAELKALFPRIRPQNILEGVRILAGSLLKPNSFPSNHAVNSFAFTLPLYVYTRKHLSLPWKIYLLSLPASVAFSRVYVGIHYPSDVAAGSLLGAAVAASVIFSYRLASRRYATRPYDTLLVAGIAAVSLFRIFYILHGPLDLSPDEAHYWEWSRRLDLSYYSKGPLVAYLIFAGTSLFGDTVFGIRILAVLFSAMSTVLVYRFAGLLCGEEGGKPAPPDLSAPGSRGSPAALAAALLSQVIPLFSAGGVLFTIDTPFMFFWIAGLYGFWRAVDGEGKTVHWILTGICVGLGFLAKYSMALFFPCGFLFLLFSKEKRGLLRGFKPYAALAAGIALFTPVIAWNAMNGWVTFRHAAISHVHVDEGFRVSFKTFFEFLGSQAGVVTPILFVMMLHSLLLGMKAPAGTGRNGASGDLSDRFLFWFSVPLLAFFMAKSLQGRVYANWAAPAYAAGIVSLAKRYFGRTGEGAGGGGFEKGRKWLAAGIGLAALVTALSHHPAVLRLPPKMDPTSRLKGWKEIGREVSPIYESLSRDNTVFLFSDMYQVASELAFYVEGKPRTYCINLGRRMNQYDLWPDMNDDAAAVRRKSGGNAAIHGIFVRSARAGMPADVADAFERFEEKVVTVRDRGRVVREYQIITCYGFKGIRTRKPTTY